MNDIAQNISRSPVDRRLHALAVAHFTVALFAGALSGLVLISAIAFSTSMSGLMGGTAIDTLSFSTYLGAESAFGGLIMAGLTAAAGWNLLARRWHRFGIALEVATMMVFPFGTILGGVTLVVLTHRAVRERFVTACQPANAR